MPRKFAFILLMLVCFGSSPAARAASRPLLNYDLRSVLADALATAVEGCQVPGAVMAVRDREGNVAYFTEGQADLATHQAMQKDLYFHIGSVTKTFTATAILELVDQGQVGLEDTLDQWMPGQVAGGDEITVRDLLDMRSGLDHSENSAELTALALAEPERGFTVPEILSYVNRQVNPPGQVADYNNLNYRLLEYILEQATGQKYQQALQELVIAPLGLSHTSVPYDNSLPSPYAHGYLKATQPDGSGPFLAEDSSTSRNISVFGAAGSMISTAGDLLVWLDALLAGTLLSPAMHEAQLDALPVGNDPNVGYGLGVANSHGAWGHNGDYDGVYTAAMYRYQDYDIVILSNGQTAGSMAGSSAQNIFDQVRGGLDQYLELWD
ncbi:MAG: beta-lactamase family protein [Deltaproteobacteria bacterium]|nr:beta-lactamase family protein [Deltaproteobacteria bacterium]